MAIRHTVEICFKARPSITLTFHVRSEEQIIDLCHALLDAEEVRDVHPTTWREKS